MVKIEIKLNGKVIEIEKMSLHELRKISGYGNDDVTIYNGFQTNDDYLLKKCDEVSLIKRGVMPKEEELEALMCSRHTPKVHEKVKKARVAIAGLGGLGSNVAINLARTGVGHIHLVDFDIVEPSNLNRQNYRICHLGLKKAEALKLEIEEINPYIEVIAEDIKVTEDNAVDVFAGDEIVCEAFDNADAKAMLINELLVKRQDIKVVAASGMAGYGSSNDIVTKKVNSNFYICGDGESEAHPGMGLMAPRVSVCAGHQANMILRLILNSVNK